jgi:hypothetical protein
MRRLVEQVMVGQDPAAALREAADLPSGFLTGSRFKTDLFHGTSRRLGRGFSLRPDVGGEFGIYLSPRSRYARLYGSNVYRVLVSVKNPLVVADKSEVSPADLTQADIDRLSAQGYDSIVSGEHEVVLFKPIQAFVWSGPGIGRDV